MILRRYHQRRNDSPTDEQSTDAPPAEKPTGRSAATKKGAKATDGG